MTLPAGIHPAELKVFLNHIYEFKKGVRQLVLYTANRAFEQYATERLKSQNIRYAVQHVDDRRVNIYFGKEECIQAIGLMVTRPLTFLSPEEDFILGAMLGYDICGQCRRYCKRKKKNQHSNGNQISQNQMTCLS